MREIACINKGWQFYLGCEDIRKEKGGQSVDLPHTWNAEDGQNGGNDYFRGKCVYKKTLKASELPKGERSYIEIEAANSVAEVFLNGNLIASHKGGYSAFRGEMTKFVERKNEIAIVVDNSHCDSVYPQIADFTFYGGLYRSVKIIAVSKTHFELDHYGGSGIMVTPVIKDGKAEVSLDAIVHGDKVVWLLS